MIKDKGYLAHYRGLKIVFVIIAVFMFLESAVYFNAVPAVAKVQAKSTDSMRLERKTTEGIVIGALDQKTNTLSWKAVPYAKPPIGELRWKEPRKPDKRSGPLQADKFCEICPQYIDHDGNRSTPQVIQGNEDCLYLNIWRPKTAAAGLPVFFWIHGGGNSIQWPLLSKTDASILAGKSNMVVVTASYRLGPMGFFSHPALRSGQKGDEKSDSGNFALLDLIQALTWVKANIKSFGGDPGNVTIIGESAGGLNVICLIASPLAKNLFHRAISQSGSVRITAPAQAAEHVNAIIAKLIAKDGKAPDEKVAVAKLKKMSLKDIGLYLRSKSAGDFLDMYPEGKLGGMIWFPTSFTDGSVLPKDFYGALQAGNFNKVPTILGTNKEEAKLFLRSDPRFTPWILDGTLYKDPAKTELYNLAAKYQSEGWKVMGVDNLARILSSKTARPMFFAYQFLWGAGGMTQSVLSPPISLLLGSCHAMEIDFVFGTEAASLGGFAFNEKNRAGRVSLSNAIMDYWARFARTGNPNRKGSGLPQWSPWSIDEGSPKIILLDADLNSFKIEMSTAELTNEAIEKSLKTEPRQKEIQPFWDTSFNRLRNEKGK